MSETTNASRSASRSMDLRPTVIAQPVRRSWLGVSAVGLLVVGALTIWSRASAADELGAGRLPIAIERVLDLSAADRLEISGRVDQATGADVVVRIDDDGPNDYANRFNREQRLAAGPFRIVVPLRGLRAGNGRGLKLTSIQRIVVFTWPEGGNVMVDRLATVGDVGAHGGLTATAAPGRQSLSRRQREPSDGPISLGSGHLPISVERAMAFGDDDELVIEGRVLSASKAALAVRIDDGQSSNYGSRYNDERELVPGPFSIALGLKGLRTPRKRVLDHRDIRRIIVFLWKGNAAIDIKRLEVRKARLMPAGVKAYSFGALDAALPSGFERIGPGDARLVGGKPLVVRRPMPDPLVANGLKGLDRVMLASPLGNAGGRVRVTLFTEDPGEWELLPHPLKRKIRVNGVVALDSNLTAQAWIRQRYIAGGRLEHLKTDDAWTAFGRRRGGLVSVEVNAGPAGIEIALEGNLDARFLSGAVVEPAGSTAGRDFVQESRAAWYRSRFPVDTTLPDAEAAVAVGLPVRGEVRAQLARAVAAPGSGVRVRLAVTANGASTGLEFAPRVSIVAPRRGSGDLGVRLWAGMGLLERNETVLRLTDNRLVADPAAVSLMADKARTFEAWVSVPANAAAGLYRGGISFSLGARKVTVPIEVEVIAVRLPPALKPAGFYLAEAAYLTYFRGLWKDRGRQVRCDLDLMASFGLTNTAPPFGPMESAKQQGLVHEMERARAAGVSAGWLVYNPMQEVMERLAPARGAELVAQLSAAVSAAGLPQPTWTIADEPGNPIHGEIKLKEWATAIRKRVAGINLAGHLNAREDRRLVGLFDTVIINEGYGIDARSIAEVSAQGKKVWIYNTFSPRVTAGFWLWRTKADRYVQWHGRLPTADPFDPLDGREADFQMIFPSDKVCQPQPDIHRDLLRMAEGVVDQRWLAWLDAQSGGKAKALAAEFRRTVGDTFAKAKSMKAAELGTMRQRIVELARSGG